MRRATLRGQVNLDKRYKIAAATYNLSQLMRHHFGIGTPKQAAASVLMAFSSCFGPAWKSYSHFFVLVPVIQSPFLSPSAHLFRPDPSNQPPAEKRGYFNRLLGETTRFSPVLVDVRSCRSSSFFYYL